MVALETLRPRKLVIPPFFTSEYSPANKIDIFVTLNDIYIYLMDNKNLSVMKLCKLFLLYFSSICRIGSRSID